MRESATGITSLERVKTMRMCDGMSSGPSAVVLEVGRVFRHEPVEKFFEIAASRWVRVFHDDKAATGVLNENGQRARDDAAAVQDFRNLIGNFISPFAASADGDRLGVDAQRGH